MSCEEEVSPRCKKAIEKNECPFCGAAIMDERLKEGLSALTLVMGVLHTEFKEQLDDWLDKNYQYIDKSNLKPGAIKREVSGEDDGGVVPREVFKQNAEQVHGKVKELTPEAKRIVEELKSGKRGPQLASTSNVVDLNNEEGQEVDGSDFDKDMNIDISTNELGTMFNQIAQNSVPPSMVDDPENRFLERANQKKNGATERFKNGGGRFKR
jgi:hypothetical protein